jgi:predicted RNase H-like HicB family nuclease
VIIILENIGKGEAATELKNSVEGRPKNYIQNSKGKAKVYQVKQVLIALDKLEENYDIKNDRYTYRITFSEEDNEYVGLCAEFPSLSWLADTPEAALKGIRKLVGEVLEGYSKEGGTIPEPIACKKYSANF